MGKSTNQPKPQAVTTIDPLIAQKYFSGFELAHDTYNAISATSDGKIYYILSSTSSDIGGQFYRYDPVTDKTKFLADLTDVCGESESKSIPQGKSHTRFFEKKGKLYFATHVGFYEIIDGMERLPENPPEGLNLFPGGHILSYDLDSGEFEDLAMAPVGEGFVAMTMDLERSHIFAISWPKGYFIHYDLNTKRYRNFGKISANGEAGRPGDDYRVLCRSMFVDPKEGAVYFSTSEGDIFSFTPGADSIKKMAGVDLRLDYFGKYDVARPGNMAYNWRKITWYPAEEVAYGVHGNSGYLFRFDPRNGNIQLEERITSDLSRRSGMFDQFSYGYLGFKLGPDAETLFYLTGGPVYMEGRRIKGDDAISKGGARGLENLHLVTYHIPSQKYMDHGPIFYKDGTRPTYVNSIAIYDGYIYTLARFDYNGRTIQDLVKIPCPSVTH